MKMRTKMSVKVRMKWTVNSCDIAIAEIQMEAEMNVNMNNRNTCWFLSTQTLLTRFLRVALRTPRGMVHPFVVNAPVFQAAALIERCAVLLKVRAVVPAERIVSIHLSVRVSAVKRR